MKKVLLARDLHPLLLREQSIFTRSDIAVFLAATNDEILKVHTREKVNVIVTKLDMPGIASDQLFTVIRQTPDLKQVSILMLREDTIGQREWSKQCNCNLIMVMPVDPGLLSIKAQELLTVAPRQAYRIVLNIAVDGRCNNKPFMCRMENLSATGMLINTVEKLSLNEHLSCSFYLPDGTRVSAHGKIMRVLARGAGNATDVYGIKFTDIPREMKIAIEQFVQKTLPHPSPLPAAPSAYHAAEGDTGSRRTYETTRP